MKDFQTILRRIADEYGTTPEVVYLEMREAVDAGFGCDEADVQAAWNQISYYGERPTPEDVLDGIAKKLTSAKESH